MKVAQKYANNDSKRSATDAQKSSWQSQLAQVSNDSEKAVAQRALKDDINDSPRMLAQRQQIGGYLGSGQSQATVTAQLKQQLDLKPNNTGLPNNLKAGIESLSGMSMDDVRVHYNSDKPAQLQALAYTQGSEIHVSKGQERHLPHEAWHVVQQKQGRVQPTVQEKGVAINDNRDLEGEADLMGKNAIQMKCSECDKDAENNKNTDKVKSGNMRTIQLAKGDSCYAPGYPPTGPVSPYRNVYEYFDQIGPNEKFTDTQANSIYAANALTTHSAQTPITTEYKSDTDNAALARLSKVNDMIAEVDHIVPQAKNGCNSVTNAQLISSFENGLKGDMYPYRGYKGKSVLDPTSQVWYPNKAAAIAGGARKANLL